MGCWEAMTAVGEIPSEIWKKFMPYLTLDLRAECESTTENVYLLSICLFCPEANSQVVVMEERAGMGGPERVTTALDHLDAYWAWPPPPP